MSKRRKNAPGLARGDRTRELIWRTVPARLDADAHSFHSKEKRKPKK